MRVLFFYLPPPPTEKYTPKSAPLFDHKLLKSSPPFWVFFRLGMVFLKGAPGERTTPKSPPKNHGLVRGDKKTILNVFPKL
jgi:hypothetical protein